MRYGREYDRGLRRSRPARYDREAYGRGGYDHRGGYGGGWGMTGLFQHMMRNRTEPLPERARPISRQEAPPGDRWQSWSGPRGRGYDRDRAGRSGLGVGRWGYDRF